MGTMAADEMELAGERARLVRLCGRLSGDPAAAEDLAQETLVEAYRSGDRLRDPERWRGWLSGIARNVCRRRWGRRTPELTTLALSDDADPADDFDVEVELERAELATLLDRAMALLPAETRAVLVQRYVEESPVGEIAARLGLSEGAVAMRLQRGKLTLRRVLTTGFRDEAAAYGLVDDEEWQTTRIWCSFCGGQRLLGRFSADRGRLEMRCPGCGCWSNSMRSEASDFHWDGVKGFRPALSRILEWHRRHHLPGLLTGSAQCPSCGRPAPLELEAQDEPAPRWISSRCRPCGGIAREPHEWLVLSLPEARRFSRVRFAGSRPVEAEGRPALVTSFESVAGTGRLDVVSAADTLAVLSAHPR